MWSPGTVPGTRREWRFAAAAATTTHTISAARAPSAETARTARLLRFLRAAYALRPGVPATMAGIEENQLWSRQRRGFLDRLWGRLVGPGVGTAQAKGRQARQGGKQMAAVNGRHGKRHFNVRGSLLFLRYLNLSTEVH